MSKHTPMFLEMEKAMNSDPAISTNLLSEIKGSTLNITFNRPARYNAFTPDMYHSLTHLIQFAN